MNLGRLRSLLNLPGLVYLCQIRWVTPESFAKARHRPGWSAGTKMGSSPKNGSAPGLTASAK